MKDGSRKRVFLIKNIKEKSSKSRQVGRKNADFKSDLHWQFIYLPVVDTFKDDYKVTSDFYRAVECVEDNKLFHFMKSKCSLPGRTKYPSCAG